MIIDGLDDFFDYINGGTPDNMELKENDNTKIVFGTYGDYVTYQNGETIYYPSIDSH